MIPQYLKPSKFLNQDGPTSNPPSSAATRASEQREVNDGQNNDRNNQEDIANFWEDPPEENSGNEPQRQEIVVKQPEKELTESERINAHFDKVGFTKNFDMSKFVEMAEKGDFTDFVGQVEQFGRRIYAQTIADMSAHMEAKINEAIDTAVSRATGAVGADQSIAYMNAQLPYTTNELIKPVANAALQRAMQKGMTKEKAVEQINKMFSAMGTKLPRQPKPPSSRSGNGFAGADSFDTGNQGNADEGVQIDFDAVFKEHGI